MKRPIEHEYNSFVSYARELEKYCDWKESVLIERDVLIAEYLSIAKDSVHEITTLRTAAQQALEALVSTHKGRWPDNAPEVITALTAALESKND
jgi:hypothetical protein